MKSSKMTRLKLTQGGHIMSKKLEFVPIYKGQINMTPDQYEKIDQKRDNRILYGINTIGYIVALVATSYLFLSVLRVAWR